jgi:hypothetical protein
MFKGFFIITLISLFFVACDCVTHKSGLILDSQTGEPIQGANIKLDTYETKSDSNGYFVIELFTGFCPDWDFLITKESYKPFELSIDLKGDYVIYKVKNENKYIKYPEPIPHPIYENSTLNGEWKDLNSIQFTAITKDSLIIKLEKTGTNNVYSK